MNVYYICLTLGGALALLLSALSAAAPVVTQDVLPVGGSDFAQNGVIIMVSAAAATLIDLWKRRDK